MMKNFSALLSICSVAVGALLLSSNASAAPIQCPGTDPLPTGTNRVMDLTPAPEGTASCYDWGEGNETGFEDLLWKIEFQEGGGENTEGSGPNPFKSFTGGLGLSGSLEFVSALSDHFLVFKFGGGGGDPDWFAYQLTGMLSADWALRTDGSTDPGTLNGLSHVSVYGPGPDITVPEPATLGLLGLGLLGMGYRLRRRRNL